MSTDYVLRGLGWQHFKSVAQLSQISMKITRPQDIFRITYPHKAAVPIKGYVMETIVDRGCGIDVHNQIVVACIMGTGIKKEMRTYTAMTKL